MTAPILQGTMLFLAGPRDGAEEPRWTDEEWIKFPVTDDRGNDFVHLYRKVGKVDGSTIYVWSGRRPA